jgi:hypothetical protein
MKSLHKWNLFTFIQIICSLVTFSRSGDEFIAITVYRYSLHLTDKTATETPSAVAALLRNNGDINVLYGIFLQNVFFLLPIFAFLNWGLYILWKTLKTSPHSTILMFNRFYSIQCLFFIIETHCAFTKFVYDTQNNGFWRILSTASSFFSFSVLHSEQNQICMYTCI